MKHIGVVFQADHLIEELTALENVMLPLEVQGEPAAAARDAAASALGRVGLDGLGDRHPSQMSGGNGNGWGSRGRS